MKIESVTIRNFRCFQQETIEFSDYTCLVGPNGCGKSTVLSALNVFFQEQTGSSTDVAKLCDEDFFLKSTDSPVEITVTFKDLSEGAAQALAAYVREGKLVVTAKAIYNNESEQAEVKHYGQRRGIEAFRPFFEQMKGGAPAGALNELYEGLQAEFPELPAARSKDAKAEALQNYEADHPNACTLIPSEDNFYGVRGAGKLEPFIQWVYVPAVKDASDESQEGKNTALEKLITRAVRSRTNFEAALESLRTETLQRYGELLNQNQGALDTLSGSLLTRLSDWAHPDVQFGLKWLKDPKKSVTVQAPVAGIITGEGNFLGNIARMGHGLQRSYLLALLQELAASEDEDAPTLLLGVEEPELYQHPPQARHLSTVLRQLATQSNQIVVTTHSPLFVSGQGFEDTRVIRRVNQASGSRAAHCKFAQLSSRLREARSMEERPPTRGALAKIHQELQPNIAEMFFTRVPILVEGLEDLAYLTTQLHLDGNWDEFRRLGCHFVPVNGKNYLLQPLAVARILSLPVFTVFDADGNTERAEHRIRHEKDNSALIHLLGIEAETFPAEDVFGSDHVIWKTNLTIKVKEDFEADEYAAFAETARQNYGQEGGLEKNSMFIAEFLTIAHESNRHSASLQAVCNAILQYASAV